MTDAAPVPVPPPMPAAIKSISAPSIAEDNSSFASNAASLPFSGSAPAPRPFVISEPICIIVAPLISLKA